MNKPSLVHPDLMESMEENFLTKKIDIQEKTTNSYQQYNEPVITWTDKHTDVRCSVGPDTVQEVKQENKTIRQTVKRILLNDVYAVDETMRVVLGSENYDILSVEFGMTETKTSLLVRKSEV